MSHAMLDAYRKHDLTIGEMLMILSELQHQQVLHVVANERANKDKA